ncbi:MAG: DUF4364 family protein [Clostridia bacterium]|nr:DUF4364 family protein [Clostridia bacterium]
MKIGKGSPMKHKTDVKIFILFLLNAVRHPLLMDEIIDLVETDGFIESFDFTACFSELLELGHIIKGEENGKTMYMISPLGMVTAANLEDSLVASIRKRSMQTATRYLSLRRRGAKIESQVEKGKNGMYTVSCRAYTEEAEIASFSLTIPSLDMAEGIRRHFKENPEAVIRSLTVAATGEIEYLMAPYRAES